jgi:hypothetical protein
VNNNGSGGSFCTQAANDAAQLSHLSSGLVTPGATPNVAAVKQLIATLDQAVDSLDSAAPSEIASDFHTLRSAYDQAASEAQSASTFQQLATVFTKLDNASLKSAATHVEDYFKNTCGITPPASTP